MAMRTRAVILALCMNVHSAFDVASNYTFAQYKAAFGRTYSVESQEHSLRESFFQKRLQEVLEHNTRGSSWKKGLNHLSDLTDDEMSSRYGYRPSTRSASMKVAGSSLLETVEGRGAKSCSSHQSSCASADSACCSGLICGVQGICEQAKKVEVMDWTEQLTTGKDIMEQGNCGSCWAVAAAGALTMHAEIASNKRFKKVLSPQNMLACTPNKMECGGQGGCKGATAELAFEWLKNRGDKGGMYTVDDQEYTADDSGCSAPDASSFLQARTRASVTITGWKKLEENSATEMMAALATAGPMVASIAANPIQSYSSGVIDTCDSFVVNHAVVMMGYGHDHEHDMPYWNLKNSWGANWGEKGFFRIQRFATPTGGKEEPCGYDMEPDKGVVCKDKEGPDGKYPAKQWVCGSCGVLIDTSYPIGTQVPDSLLEGNSASGSKQSAAGQAETEVRDNGWCRTQCQHFAMPKLSEAFAGADFGSSPASCEAQCDTVIPA